MLTCTISSPDRTVRYADVRSVTLPTLDGEMQILAGHAELFTSLRSGAVGIRLGDGSTQAMPVTGGECHVRKDAVVVIL